MEKPELVAGLKHALERGYSLDQAIQSFKNAGYNSQDVEDSARNLHGVFSTMPTLASPAEPQPPQAPQIPIKPPVQAAYSEQAKSAQQPKTQQLPQQMQPKTQQLPQTPHSLQPPQAPPQPVQKTAYQQPKAPRKKTGLIIFLIIILLILIGALIVTLFAKEQVVGLIETLLEKIGI